jgi:hypothetical protein
MIEGSKPIDPDFGKETQIRIKIEVRDMIEKAKIIPRESANDCIKRIFTEYQYLYKENRKFKKMLKIEEGADQSDQTTNFQQVEQLTNNDKMV